MNSYIVKFLPDNKSIEVEKGTKIAEAAPLADIFINNLCGGEGVCGQCRVRIINGRAPAEEQAKNFFSDEELKNGFVLACQTPVNDNLEILISAGTRLEESKIMTGESSSETTVVEVDPLVNKMFLTLPIPNHEDNISDMERVSREIRKKTGVNQIDVSLDCLRKFSDTLRQSDWNITVTIARNENRYQIIKIEPRDTTEKNYGVAIDVGTTTVVAQLVDTFTGKVLGVEGTHNPQASYGEDVISRIIYSCGKDGLETLHDTVIKSINKLIDKLSENTGILKEEIYSVVAAGNTTMSHLLLGLSPRSIRLAPYVPTANIYPQVKASEIGININPDAVVETIPSVASYVGGDIVTGVVACGMTETEEIKILIDIGTNGEIAIGNKEWLMCCSASAGPAFEGGGTRCGMRATTGAIEKIEIIDGKVVYNTIGNKKPKGICGSGLIDCIYELVRNRIIGADGKFNRDIDDIRLTFEENIPQYTIATSNETESGKPIVITENDINNLMKSKGAVFAAIKTLIDYIGLDFDSIDTFFVAGGFGNYLNIPKSVAIGLLPDIPREKIRFIGNSSLTGARMCLLSQDALKKCLEVSASMTNIELSIHQPFMDEYVASLFLPHTDRRLFPSVTY